jgi:hypothetical protein
MSENRINVMSVLDAAGSAFFQRELEHIKAATYDIKYPELTYDKVFPVSNEANPGMTHITFHTFDQRGIAKVVMNYAGDLPRVDIEGKETTVPVRTLGAAFGYTIDEINASKVVGRQLDRRRADAARRAIEELMNRITWLGDAVSGLLGVFTHPNIPAGSAIDIGAGVTAWSSKSPIQIRDDINLGFRNIFTTTKMVEKADTLCLPPSQYAMVLEKALAAENNLTIAKWFVQNSPWIASLDRIIPVPELAGAGPGGTDVALFMTSRADKLQVEIPQDVFFHEVEKRSLEYITDVTARFAGLNVYYPLSMYIMTGI